MPVAKKTTAKPAAKKATTTKQATKPAAKKVVAAKPVAKTVTEISVGGNKKIGTLQKEFNPDSSEQCNKGVRL